MGFGGVGSMNIVMKNNRNLLRNGNREKFKNGLGSHSVSEKLEFNLPKASPQLLKAIREKMIFDNEQRQHKKNIVFAFIIIALITLFVMVLS